MNDKPKRLFFAILPDTKSLEEILALQKHYNSNDGHWIRKENIHITLYFLGNLSKQQTTCVLNNVKQIQHHAFNLCFDKCEYVKRRQILWMGTSEDTVNIVSLYKKVCSALLDCELELEKRPYTPHITLARKFKSKQGANIDNPICIPVNKVHLMESVPIVGGVEYHIVDSFSLI